MGQLQWGIRISTGRADSRGPWLGLRYHIWPSRFADGSSRGGHGVRNGVARLRDRHHLDRPRTADGDAAAAGR